jgi:site-specific recombinase XerD
MTPDLTSKPAHALALFDHGTSADEFARGTNAAVLYLAALQSPKSQQTMRRVLNQVAKMTGQKDLYAVDWSLLRRESVFRILQTLIHEGRSESTRNLYLAAIKGVAKEAYLSKQLSSDDYERIRLVKSVSVHRLPKGRDLALKEIGELMDHCLCQDGPAGVRDAAILALLFGCGPRRSELVSIDIGGVNLGRGEIRVVGKGAKERQLELPSRTKETLEFWLRERGDHDGPLFVRIDRWGNLGNQRLTDRAVYNIVKKRVAQAGIGAASPHDLRRSFITYLLNEGVDIGTVASMAGHSDINTTRIYARQQEGRNKEAARKIDF